MVDTEEYGKIHVHGYVWTSVSYKFLLQDVLSVTQALAKFFYHQGRVTCTCVCLFCEFHNLCQNSSHAYVVSQFVNFYE